MIRFLSIAKGASGCILTLMFCTISIETQTRPHHATALVPRGSASDETCAVACRQKNQDRDWKCHWSKIIHGNEAWSYHILTRTFTWSTKQIEKLVILGGTTSTSLFVTFFGKNYFLRSFWIGPTIIVSWNTKCEIAERKNLANLHTAA